MSLSQEDIEQLTGGGLCFLHDHEQPPADHVLLERLQQLEVVKELSADTDLTQETDLVFVDSTAGIVSVTLPPARNGRRIVVSRTAGANNVTVVAYSGDSVNGAGSVTISASFTPLRLKAVSGNWYSV